MIDSYELRQLLLLQQITSKYINNHISLNIFIAKIEELLDLLEEFDDIWHENIKALWFDLEVINSIKLVNQEQFTQNDLQKINNITSSIEKLINEKLAQYE
ncbi:MAG: hypothetical protein ACIPMY_06210 [Rickettsia endosymbiont of Pentastiridius leporinus]